MKVYVMTAEHQTTPGMRLSVHHSMQGALTAAVDVLSIMVKDTWNLGYDADDVAEPTMSNWSDVEKQLQDIHGGQYVYVDITTAEVQS